MYAYWTLWIRPNFPHENSSRIREQQTDKFIVITKELKLQILPTYKEENVYFWYVVIQQVFGFVCLSKYS